MVICPAERQAIAAPFALYSFEMQMPDPIHIRLPFTFACGGKIKRLFLNSAHIVKQLPVSDC